MWILKYEHRPAYDRFDHRDEREVMVTFLCRDMREAAELGSVIYHQGEVTIVPKSVLQKLMDFWRSVFREKL